MTPIHRISAVNVLIPASYNLSLPFPFLLEELDIKN